MNRLTAYLHGRKDSLNRAGGATEFLTGAACSEKYRGVTAGNS